MNIGFYDYLTIFFLVVAAIVIGIEIREYSRIRNILNALKRKSKK